MNHLLNTCLRTKWKDIKQTRTSVLLLKNLSFGFFIWLGFCGLCVGVFVFEVVFWLACRKFKIFWQQRHKSSRFKIMKVKNAKVWPIQ